MHKARVTTSTLLFLLNFFTLNAQAQTNLATGAQPQITVDAKEVLRVVYGDGENIYYSVSSDKGRTFSKPALVARVPEMHLGMTRGPQLATSKDFSIVTAMDKAGNINCFMLTHKTGKWDKIQNVNDVDRSAPEGLMSLSADNSNNFYAVWLDVREGRKNNICFSSLSKKSKWTNNRFVYKSPEGNVCDCCKPSIAVNGNNVSIMFRNWLKGSRDLYLITSSNAGQSFSEAQKLGNGTWPLKGCPMDGGGLSIDSENNIHTAWQRDGQIFYAQPGLPEEKIGDGRGVGMNAHLVWWEDGSNLTLKHLGGEKEKIGEGTALKAYEFTDKTILAIWQKDKQIVFKKL